MWPMGLLFIKTFPAKQYSYQNDFSGVFEALHQGFPVFFVTVFTIFRHLLTYFQLTASKKDEFFGVKLTKQLDSLWSFFG